MNFKKKNVLISSALAATFCVSLPFITPMLKEAKSSENKEVVSWLAGDHHIHTEYSYKYDYDKNPITFEKGGDAAYPIEKQAEMAEKFGLDWIVMTDHGGPDHARVNHEEAYPDLLDSRKKHEDLLQFYGLEFNPAGADHVSLIMPKNEEEADNLFKIEKIYGRGEVANNPEDSTEDKMNRAVQYLTSLPKKNQPLMFANHPGRDHSDIGVYDGRTSTDELRRWNNLAPSIFMGMEGAPGHQADFYGEKRGRGIYEKAPTMGGYDQMTAVVGGFWDSMLAEDRKYWITGTSDMHEHHSDGGREFWPGEYTKMYVKSAKDYDHVMDSMKQGRMFVTTGDLISELDIVATNNNKTAEVGDELFITKGKNNDLTIDITFRDPNEKNANGDNPKVNRVDLIMGEISGTSTDNTNPTTEVVKRFTEQDFKHDGEYITLTHTLTGIDKDSYIRVRGTNTNELEPELDPKDENPWTDLWFYSNPIFFKTK